MKRYRCKACGFGRIRGNEVVNLESIGVFYHKLRLAENRNIVVYCPNNIFKYYFVEVE